MKRLLAVIESLRPTQLFCVGYAWHDTVLGELEGSTVVDARDEATALQSFRRQNRHVNRAWIVARAHSHEK